MESWERNAKSKPSQKSIPSGVVRVKEAGQGQKLRSLPTSSEVISGPEPKWWEPLQKKQGLGMRVEQRKVKGWIFHPAQVAGDLQLHIPCFHIFMVDPTYFPQEEKKKKKKASQPVWARILPSKAYLKRAVWLVNASSKLILTNVHLFCFQHPLGDPAPS